MSMEESGLRQRIQDLGTGLLVHRPQTLGLEAVELQARHLEVFAADATQEQLRKLYKDKKDYQAKVAKSVEEMTRQGWSLPVYKDVILEDAAKVSF